MDGCIDHPSWRRDCPECGRFPAPNKRATRTDKDYAIEFGEYLATSADDFLTALNHRDAAQRLSDFGAEQVADEALTDHWKALQEAVYEFRKRAARAGHEPSTIKLKPKERN